LEFLLPCYWEPFTLHTEGTVKEGTVEEGLVEESDFIAVEDVTQLVVLDEVREAGHPVVHGGMGHS